MYVAIPVIAAVAYLALCYMASRSVYFPAKYPEGLWDAQALWRATDVWLDSADGVRIQHHAPLPAVSRDPGSRIRDPRPGLPRLRKKQRPAHRARSLS